MKTFRQYFAVLCTILFLLTVNSAAAQEKEPAAGDKKEQIIEEKKAIPEATEKKADLADKKPAMEAEKKADVKTADTAKPTTKKADAKLPKSVKAPAKKTAPKTNKAAKPAAKKADKKAAAPVKGKSKKDKVKTDKAPETAIKKPDEKPAKTEKATVLKTEEKPEKKATPDKESKKDILTDVEKAPDKEPEKKEENVADKKEEAVADNTTAQKPQIIVINPGSADAAAWSSTWGPLIDGAAIYAWGRGQNLYMKEDMGPVVDKMAAFVSLHGTYVTVKDLRTSGMYILWLDLVSFRNPDSAQFPSTLKIFIRSRRHDYRLMRTCSFPHAGGELLRIEIPFEMSAEGEITILFRELSPMKRTWGIWDMIITDTRELPLSPDYYRQIHEPVKLPVKEKILE
ncbi:MAG: hypothetical protein CVV44_15345 [Spirochaetae bacterium HGW-Spirochaetae-1]|jgi:hypothetical protein|nr:MAG: hypothetical protein CVV44_15345 [Spirochaetae bacterium HGW-Spirochaetae-1]